MDDTTKSPLAETTDVGMARRLMLGGAGLAGAAALLAAGIRPAAAADAGPFPAHAKWKFVFVNHVTTNPFFVPTQYGIQDACALLGCDFQWTGSATSDAAEMVNAMNSAIAAKADAIAVPIVDPKAFDRPTERALDAGIPVFAYNADKPAGSANQRLAYIGQDLYASGFGLGQRIAASVDSGTVALFIATPGQLNLQPRLDGAQDAIKKSGKSLTVDVIATGATVNEELSEDQGVLSRPPECEGHDRRGCRQHAGRRRDHAVLRSGKEGRACRRVRPCCRARWS